MIFTKKHTLLVLVVITLFPKAKSKIHMKNHNASPRINRISNHFSTFMVNIGKEYFKEKEAVFFIVPSFHAEMGAVIEKTIKKISNEWTIFTKETYCCDFVKREMMYRYGLVPVYHVPSVYVVPFYQTNTFKYFQAQITTLQESDDFNPRALFFVILLTEENGKDDADNNVKRIYNLMWKNNLFGTTLFLLSNENNITVAHAEPFSSENRCRTVMENGIQYKKISTPTKECPNLFYKERINLQKCDIEIGTIPLPPYVVGKPKTIDNETHYEYTSGIEVELVRLLSEIMNFTTKFHKTHSYKIDAWFYKFPNGTIIGILQDLIDHNVDIAYGSFIPDYITYYRYDYSSSYKFSTISCYVSDPNFIPQWSIFFVAFPPEVWVLSILAFVTVSLLYSIMEPFGVSTQENEINFKAVRFADFFSINLGMGSILNPKSAHLRVLFFAWAIYSVHWYSAYTSTLFTYITNPPLEKEIRTIDDFKQSGLRVSLDETYTVVFKHQKLDEITKLMLDNHITCTHLETCLHQFVKDRNFSVMDKAEAIEYLINVKQYKVHKLSQNMMTYFVSTITTKGNPVSRTLSKLARRALEGGLFNKWEEDVRLQYNNIINVNIPSDNHAKPLTITDLIGSFLILFFGLLVSFILFLIESIVHLCERNKVEKL